MYTVRKNRKRPFEWLLSRLKNKCLSRNLQVPCELTYEEFLSLTDSKVCHYCKAPITWNPYGSGSNPKHSKAYNLDRKDNSIGYTKNNCVVCCGLCNKVKSSILTYEEMLEIGKVLQKRHTP